MMKSYQIVCLKCNHHQNFYRYGKDSDGYQKYLWAKVPSQELSDYLLDALKKDK